MSHWMPVERAARRKWVLQNGVSLFQCMVQGQALRTHVLRTELVKRVRQRPRFSGHELRENVLGRDVVGRNPTDRGRKATKASLLVDSKGMPLCTVFHRGNKSDVQSLGHVLNDAARRGVPLRRYASLLADKGYDSETCRAPCRAHGLTLLIPRRRTADSFTGRYVVEQTFGLIDQFRRLRVRYESLARNFKSMHYIACSAIAARR